MFFFKYAPLTSNFKEQWDLICSNATSAVMLERTEDYDLYLEFIVILIAQLSAYAAHTLFLIQLCSLYIK